MRINKGLDLPITGAPNQVPGQKPSELIDQGPAVRHVALVGDDYVGLKPTMTVADGDFVRVGQVVFTDKKIPGIQYTAPASGKVAIHRGAKRKFLALVITCEGDDRENFDSYSIPELARLDRQAVRDQLVVSGLWTALRTRPFSKVPSPESIPHSLFVTAIDTNPLAADPSLILAAQQEKFSAGLQVLSLLADGKVHVCHAEGAAIPGMAPDDENRSATYHAFSGPHPAGLVGTHVHAIDPASENKTLWHIGYQDVVAVGHLFLTGELMTERIVSLAGPMVRRPRLIRTRLGASLTELTRSQVESTPSGPHAETSAANDQVRVLSGSVLSGRHAASPTDFLGRYHTQISVLAEGTEREFLGWMAPGLRKFSIRRVFASALFPPKESSFDRTSVSGAGIPAVDADMVGHAKPEGRLFPMTTSTGGSRRAVVPIGMYEEVMPLDIMATPLLKALLVQDTEFAQQLGALELDEEDLALCTFVCPGKNDYGPLLRECLTRIELEG